jgi:hypothetical protein
MSQKPRPRPRRVGVTVVTTKSAKAAKRPARKKRARAVVNYHRDGDSGEQGNGVSPPPVFRRLRGYTFDPTLSLQLDTAVINETTYKVLWDDDDESEGKDIQPGPVGRYVEVVDYDPASDCFYAPVDLNDPHLLAQDGLPPSEGNPQFHQQMVYAVAMTTIRNFERALGRPALWAPNQPGGGRADHEYVPRLRLYPHALREANAYYSPEKKALLFGYFPAPSDRPERYLPGGIVFTCLSHDIIAHETTHALLDGMHRRFIEANHPDALAFHEAFADIVALFQHFTFPEVLRSQIARTRGDLAAQNLLGELAQQFGEAVGNYGALRSAIGTTDPETGQWRPLRPDPGDYQRVTEPHERGAILVAAVFDAFLSIYKGRVADLLRIATSGTGVLPEGALHPDLVSRLASEAAKSAQHVLHACIRALDYCPPVDITFGDYLRAIITADVDLVPDDDMSYRIAFIDAFRRRGIYPRDVRTLSTESLRWPLIGERNQGFFKPLTDFLRTLADRFRYIERRREIYDNGERAGAALHTWFKTEGRHALKSFGKDAGITFKLDLEGLRPDPRDPDVPAFQVHSLRPAQRVGPDGNALNQLIISVIQSRDIPPDPQTGCDAIKFRGGCTLIIDLDTMRLRYAIKKDISDEGRLERYKDFHRGLAVAGSLRATYFRSVQDAEEPFALLHRSFDYGRP